MWRGAVRQGEGRPCTSPGQCGTICDLTDFLPISVFDLGVFRSLYRCLFEREWLGVRPVVELQPGEAVYIPSGWWHEIESLAGTVGLSLPVERSVGGGGGQWACVIYCNSRVLHVTHYFADLMRYEKYTTKQSDSKVRSRIHLWPTEIVHFHM